MFIGKNIGKAARRSFGSNTLHTAMMGFVYAVLALVISTSAVASVTAAAASKTALTASPTSVTVGSNITLSAKVTPSSGSTIPTGTVTFTVNGVGIGTVTLNKGSGAMTESTSTAIPGTYTVVAKYNGSSTFAASTASASVVLNAASSNPTGTALSSCGDLTNSGTYYLSSNLSSSGTCFFIDADNITLNLNGHTITYGTGGGSSATPALVLADDWYTSPGYNLARTGTTEKHGGFVVYGGSIIASSASGPRSTCIWVGQSNDVSPAPVMHDLTLTTTAADASPIFGTISTSGWQIYNNNIKYGSNTTSSRYNLWGYAIWLGDQPNAPGAVADNIYNNTITAAPQGGIFVDHKNAYIHNNNIAFNSFYANDYCVANLSGDGQNISSNTCHPASGRGIDVEAANATVASNVIVVTELPQDAEYGGCEGGGADGIRVRDNVYQGNPTAPTGVKISSNIITANATKCQANGLRLTNLQPNDSVTYTGNVVVSTGTGTSSIPDYAVSFDGDNQPTLNFNSNVFTSVYAFVEVDWDGANVVMNGSQNWTNTPLNSVDNENGFYDSSGTGPTFSQSIVVDASATGKIKCGVSASGPTQFGSTSKTCN